MQPLKPLFRRLHAALPDKARRQADIALICLRDTLKNWRIPAHRVQGLLPDQGESTVMYLGNRPQYVSWTHKLFGRAIEPVSMGEFSLLEILRGHHPGLAADITLCPLNPWTTPLFAQRGWRVMPLYVDCLVDLRKPINELITSKGAKDDLRVARRLGYRFELLEEDQAIHEFFHQMLVPTVKIRHEERAFLSQWQNIERTYRNGILVGAFLDDQWAGAILLAVEGPTTVRIANLGWRNGEDQWLKKGIVAALYNQSFVWAQENGFEWVNLGSSNPFANDGPLNFKLKWGATLMAPELKAADGRIEGAHSFIGVKFNLGSATAQSFLRSTPLLECTEGKLRAIGWDAEIPPLFRRQLDSGIGWINLAAARDAKSPV